MIISQKCQFIIKNILIIIRSDDFVQNDFFCKIIINQFFLIFNYFTLLKTRKLKLTNIYFNVQYKVNVLFCFIVEANCNDHQPTKLKSTSGKLASHVTDIKGCGSSGSPWIISANPGQTIQLDLVDFAASSQTSNLVSCRSVYGFILERALGINHTICGGPHREGALYTSKTNFIEIQLSSRSTRGDAHFIIKYEGNYPTPLSSFLYPYCL